MSSFKTKFRNKSTGEIHEVLCLDDYFGRHNYGYELVGASRVLGEDEFKHQYERIREVI